MKHLGEYIMSNKGINFIFLNTHANWHLLLFTVYIYLWKSRTNIEYMDDFKYCQYNKFRYVVYFFIVLTLWPT